MSSVYTLIPRPIYDFAGLDALSRYAFGLLWDRWQLSIRPENQSRFSDPHGIFCFYEQTAMAGEVGVTLPTIRRCLKALQKRGLIVTRRVGMGEPVRYYMTIRAWDHMVNLQRDDLDFLPWDPMPPGTGDELVKDPDVERMAAHIENLRKKPE